MKRDKDRLGLVLRLHMAYNVLQIVFGIYSSHIYYLIWSLFSISLSLYVFFTEVI